MKIVNPAAAETAEQADKHTDRRSNHAGNETHIQRRTQTFDKEGHVIAAEVVGTEQVISAGASVRASHHVTGIDVHVIEQRSEKGDQQRDDKDGHTDDEHRGLEKIS